MKGLLAAVSLLVLSAPAAAGIIELSRSIEVATSLDTGPIFNDPNSVTVFTFTVPPPFPGPIIDHGSQHWYFNTRLVSFTFSGLVPDGSGFSSITVLTPRDLGKITTPLTISQGFLNRDPFFQLDLLTVSPVNSIKANLIDSYVPEPGAWALFIVGFGLVGTAMRKRQARLTIG